MTPHDDRRQWEARLAVMGVMGRVEALAEALDKVTPDTLPDARLDITPRFETEHPKRISDSEDVVERLGMFIEALKASGK